MKEGDKLLAIMAAIIYAQKSTANVADAADAVKLAGEVLKRVREISPWQKWAE